MIRFLFFCVLAGCGSTACVPYPGTSSRFPGAQGVVRDARTRLPIEGVRVAIHRHPATWVATDESGRFRLRSRTNLHLGIFVGPCPNIFPAGENWGTTVDFSHPGYATVEDVTPVGSGEPPTAGPLEFEVAMKPR